MNLSKDTPDSSKKSNEVIYVAPDVGRIYVRKTMFKQDVAPPETLTLTVDSPSPVFAEKGDHPRSGRGGRKPAETKDSYTAEEVKAMEEKAAKAEERLKNQLARIEEAKKKVQSGGAASTDGGDSVDKVLS